jgi:hypothetical protein
LNGKAVFLLSMLGGFFTGIAINAAWDGIKTVYRRFSGNQIQITLPSGHGKVLSPLEPPSGVSFVAAVEGTLKRKPKHHEIWLLVEHELTGQVWPQGFASVHYDAERQTWEGKINAWSAGRVGQIRIVAVVAPPTSQEFFRYYQNVGGKLNYAFEPLSRVPVECKNKAFVQAKLL